MKFGIHFAYPLLLLIFLLGAAVTALLYFTLSKKYRKNRNRITSMVLHMIVFALAVLTLAGTVITFDIPNRNNQILLVVDVSDTEDSSAGRRDDFIRTVLNMGQYDHYNIGIVTFGFDQVYAVEMTDRVDPDEMMARYETAERPDTSATDIAAALTYASGLFENTDSAKIVLITDGKETDGEARSVIRTIAAKGIRVDVANVSSLPPEGDAQLTDAILPDYHVSPGVQCNLATTLVSAGDQEITVELYDNGTLVNAMVVTAQPGAQNVTFQHTFDTYGIHEVSFRLRVAGDALEQNNTYVSYLNIENFNKILVLEHKEESSELKALLSTASEGYEITVMNIADENLPKTLGALREYDQVILNNIANADMPEYFVPLLYTYVHDCGGGLFTVGGADPAPAGSEDPFLAHSYNREDMLNTLYQEILPVQAIRYTPPVAVMVIVDRSGSMGTVDSVTGGTKYDLALSGASSCLQALTERDYFGLMTLDSNFEAILPLTPRSQEAKIVKAINYARELETDGGTVFPQAIERASTMLLSLNVAKRHVIVVTDGEVPGEQAEEYLSYIKKYHEDDGITFSVVGIGVSPNSDAAKAMQSLCEIGGGRLHAFTDLKQTTSEMREDLNAPDIKAVNYKKFYPTAADTLSPLFTGVEFSTTEDGKLTPKLPASLEAFFGVKVKAGAEVILTGDYNVPLYAQWKFGKGTVGSFMCDLNGTWSADFLSANDKNKGAGQQFILNVVANLMPLESIRENQISISLKTDNYRNQLSIFSDLQEGERITGYLRLLSDAGLPVPMETVTVVEEGEKLTDLPCYITLALDATTNYSRCRFVIKQSGLYEIVLQKVNADGTVLSTFTTTQAFSYSKEYDTSLLPTDADLNTALDALADNGGGSLIADNEDPIEIFSDFVTAIRKTFDPRYIFMIVALVLFLADVAVRKFKFRWPHEILRDRRGKSKKTKGEKVQ